ncbi:MAG: ATP-binding cassette domain-containing protein [Clostridiales bacterium]|jgi:ATPase subunit of ABC transporter with duplicated ATPase domains|nr:ATP-binding cassette domain-containing protein [Clostridiales bacterium]
MISANGVTLQFGKVPLFEDVNIKFTEGNCYGLIGANGAGKSTFLKILSGEIEPNKGEVVMPNNERLAVLKQNHYEYDDYTALQTVIMGFARLYEIMQEKEVLYAKPDFDDADGIKISELEGEFDELDGWSAEANAATILNNLGVTDDCHDKLMKDIEADLKVKVLLAQALFGNPDVLLLDEPTNHLDIQAITWLENFLAEFENTVIVVSHDRHFLNQVCTHIADVDYRKIKLFVGNYDFWYESSQLALKQQRDQNAKIEAKAKEMQEFIQRFSANASKSKQATSRKKLLEKLVIEDIQPSSRKYPFIDFKASREIGNDLLRLTALSAETDDGKIFDSLSFIVNPGDKIALVGPDSIAKTTLFKILMGELEASGGEYKWGITTSQAYFPRDNAAYFDGVDFNLVDWLRQFSEEKSETFIRGFLGRMLFSGEESQKAAKVLSGGEKVRCMLSRMMLSGANVLLFDEPTNHLDLESITALNNGLIDTKCSLLFTSQDHQFVQTIANRIIEITPRGLIDRLTTYDEYLEDPVIAALREEMYLTDSI